MFRICFLIALTMIFLSCTSKQVREPSSLGPLQEIASTLEAARNQVQAAEFNGQTCAPVLSDIERNLNQMNWQSYSNLELEQAGDTLVHEFWKTRLQTHRRLDVMTPECLAITRRIFHVAHDHEDYLGDLAYKVKPLSPEGADFQKMPTPIYEQVPYAPLFVRDDVPTGKFPFQSGDLMLARGISFFSALISQLSDNKSSFSHVVLTNLNEKTGALNTVESYIGVGVKSYEMEFALRNENARLLILRPKDQSIAAKAAKFGMLAAEKRIPYDYEMNDRDYSRMSCVESAQYAYDKGSEGTMKIPQMPAQLSMKNKDFLRKIGMKNGVMVTPDDLETDSRFELLADWRDCRLIRDSRRKDAVLSEMIRWMEELKYNFHDTAKSRMAKDVLLPLRNTPLWPLIQNITKTPDLDPKFPRETLGVMIVLNQVAEDILKSLYTVDLQYIEQFGRPMTNQLLREAVNKLRKDDYKSYKSGGKNIIHYAFHP